MGTTTPGGPDEAQYIVSGGFTATGQSGNAAIGQMGPNAGGACPPNFIGLFNVAIWGTFVGTAQLEKSYDGGSTYIPICTDTLGTVAAYVAPITLPAFEPEMGCLYRWNCTAYTSGTIKYRISV